MICKEDEALFVYLNEELIAIITLCKENQLNLKTIPFYEQTEEIIRAACENCKNIQGVSPKDLLDYIRDDLRSIVDEYQGY
ncbi:MAG: hypothetical protein IJU79_03370 [Desulfovibrionaceae bacterium]|nr:hypothetical protein [Desulfovibrionaceae bacterium]